MLESIRRRLTWGYVGILALILILFGAIVVASFSRQVTAQQDGLLGQKAEAEADSLLGDGDEYGVVKAAAKSDVAVVALTPDGETDRGTLRESEEASISSLGLPVPEQARQAAREGKKIAATFPGPEGPVRVASVPISEGRDDEVVAVVQAAQSRAVTRETVWRLALVLGSVGCGALLLAAIGGLYMSRRAMRPARVSFEKQRAFVADASHELKTPLSLIKVNAELVRPGIANPEDREMIDDQLSEIGRMETLLSDLLVLARLDAGKLDIAREPFDLTKIVAETAGRFGARASAGNVRLDLDVPKGLQVRGDPERTGQILAALIDNALRYTPPEGRVTLSGHAHDGRVEASVTDTGPGVAPEHLPRLFDRFYRVEAARTRTGGGTGLGLAIARDLARAQSGDLKAENADGGGAVFRLTLPAPDKKTGKRTGKFASPASPPDLR